MKESCVIKYYNPFLADCNMTVAIEDDAYVM